LGKTIIGGTHASLLAEECYKDGFNYVVKGYGEDALLEIVKGKINEGVIRGKQIEPLDKLPFPAWDDLLKSDYEISYGKNVAHIFSLRGCPYTCSYCASVVIYGKKVFFRSIKNVIDEINYLRDKFNIEKLYFMDPTFTIDRNRVIGLANALKNTGLEWTCETRVDRIDEELLTIMYQGGCNLISFGIESGSVNVHSRLGKKTTINQNSYAINLAHRIGLKVKAFLMGALPEDNWNTLDEFKEFISLNKPDNWLFSTFIPFPGTEQWRNPEKYGIKIHCHDFRTYFNLGLNGRAPVNISNQFLSRDELQVLRNDMLEFLLKEVPNPRVEEAINRFPAQMEKLMPYVQDMDYKYMF
jgi:radical SAM superfamily enzyme YgiQ (UPF0313 family)